MKNIKSRTRKVLPTLAEKSVRYTHSGRGAFCAGLPPGFKKVIHPAKEDDHKTNSKLCDTGR